MMFPRYLKECCNCLRLKPGVALWCLLDIVIHSAVIAFGIANLDNVYSLIWAFGHIFWIVIDVICFVSNLADRTEGLTLWLWGAALGLVYIFFVASFSIGMRIGAHVAVTISGCLQEGQDPTEETGTELPGCLEYYPVYIMSGVLNYAIFTSGLYFMFTVRSRRMEIRVAHGEDEYVEELPARREMASAACYKDKDRNQFREVRGAHLKRIIWTDQDMS